MTGAVVVIVPGWASPNSLEWNLSPIPGRLEECGYDVERFKACDYGINDIRHNADKLSDLILDLHDRYLDVYLLAHSMGGLVSRYADCLLGKSHQPRCIITLGTPHYGTPMALLGTRISKAARQMLPGSSFIRELNDKKTGTPIYSVSGLLDTVVPFKYSNYENRGDTSVILATHSSMLYSVTVGNQIIDWLDAN